MLLDGVSRVVIVPGYGLAVAQASTPCRDLANLLEARDIQVEYAIHPVAGRMPGHMNVLLAEADVPYEVVSAEQIEKALRTQGALGGRLGTNLIELAFLDADSVAQALAKQKGVAAARMKHFEQVDKSILKLLPKHLAERHNAVPLGVTHKFGKELAVAFLDPDDIAAVDEVGFATGHRVRPSVAPEFYIIHYLDRLYNIPPRRMLRGAPVAENHDYASGRLPAMQQVAAAESAPLRAHSRAATPQVAAAPPATKPSKARADIANMSLDEGWDLPDPTPMAPPGQTRAPKDLTNVPNPMAPAPSKPLPTMLSAQDAIAIIANAQTREDIGDAIVGYLVMTFGCGLVLICKKGTALGWRGYARGADQHAIEAISLPLTVRSAFQTAFDNHKLFHGEPDPSAKDIHSRLWKLLHANTPQEVIVAPVSIKNRVVNLVYAHAADHGRLPSSADEHMMSVCNAAAQGYIDLIKRQKSG